MVWYTEYKVYVLAGDDPVRQIILSMFCTSKTIKRKDAMEECKRVTGQELSATYVTFADLLACGDAKGAVFVLPLSLLHLAVSLTDNARPCP